MYKEYSIDKEYNKFIKKLIFTVDKINNTTL